MDLTPIDTPLPSGSNAGLTPREVFTSQIKVTDTGCHEWQGKTFRNGYGCFGLKGRYLLAHRVAFALHHKRNPAEGLSVMHTCDNRPCCNPEHLTEGTHQENMKDMQAKGRSNPARGMKSYRAKLTDELVVTLRQMRESLALTYKDLGRYFGVSGKQARAICLRIQWSHI